jgi:copper chaperone CopZ
MNTSIIVDNLKCGGCANTITKKLSVLEGITNVNVDKDTSTITYDYANDTLVEVVEATLAKLGYPKQGTSSLGQKAKSYISCATGKIDM